MLTIGPGLADGDAVQCRARRRRGRKWRSRRGHRHGPNCDLHDLQRPPEATTIVTLLDAWYWHRTTSSNGGEVRTGAGNRLLITARHLNSTKATASHGKQHAQHQRRDDEGDQDLQQCESGLPAPRDPVHPGDYTRRYPACREVLVRSRLPSVLKELLAWWIGQIRDLVPQWRAGNAAPGTALVFVVQPNPAFDPPLVLVSERRRRRETEIFAFSPDAPEQERLRSLLRRRGRDLPVVVRVPSAWLLEREVVLPIAAAGEFGRVLSYEMDRFTPFRADEVIWTFMLRARDSAQQVVRARLSLVPRVWLDQPLSLLQTAGAAPSLLECDRPDGEVCTIPITRPLSARDRRRKLTERALALGCAALAVAVAALPLVRQTLARADVESQITALEPRARQAEALRARIAGALKGAENVASEQARNGNVLEILAALTQILPDDTYLTGLRLKDQTLTIEGQSAAAAKLIPALSNNPLFADPTFTAPVTRTERGRDLFELRVRINPPTSPR